jgi:NADPH:quinone reductase-like Zn-dependent oxidoreductase
VRSAVITRTGPPDVLQIREAPDPLPRAGEIRIAVRAAGVNFADIMARLGLYPDAPKLPAVVGYEVAGVVDAVGDGVDGFRAGDRVLALTRFGGYASAVLVSAAQAFPVPPQLSDAEAAAIPVNYLTAYIALYKLAGITAGETVLIYGAGGGVGIAATQLAKLRKATVIGTASPGKLEAIRSLGVDHAIDRTREDVTDVVQRLTSHRGADVVLDSIGGKNFSVSYKLLAPLGRLIIFGASSLAVGERRSLWHTLRTIVAMPKFGPLSLMNQNRAVMGLNLGHLWTESRQLGAAMDEILALVAAGHLRPIVAKTFPLEQAADAHRYIQARGNIGKVLLMIDG